jgi:hypothetical protein
MRRSYPSTSPSLAAASANRGAASRACPPLLLTRAQAARLAGVSKTTIRRAQRTGKFTPYRSASGEQLVDATEVRAWTARRHRRLCALAKLDPKSVGPFVFALFDGCEDPADVVVTHQIDPHRVAELHALWVRMRGMVVTPPRYLDVFVREMAELLSIPERPIRSLDDLSEWLAGAEQQLRYLYAFVRGAKVDRSPRSPAN